MSCPICKTQIFERIYMCTSGFSPNGKMFCKYCRTPFFKQICECIIKLNGDKQICESCIEEYYRGTDETCDECEYITYDRLIPALCCGGCTSLKFKL